MQHGEQHPSNAPQDIHDHKMSRQGLRVLGNAALANDVTQPEAGSAAEALCNDAQRAVQHCIGARTVDVAQLAHVVGPASDSDAELDICPTTHLGMAKHAHHGPEYHFAGGTATVNRSRLAQASSALQGPAVDNSRGARPSSVLDRGQNGAASLTEEPSSLPDHVHSVLERRQASTEERELPVAAHSSGLQSLPTGPARAGPGLHVAGTEPEHPQGLSTSSSPSLAREELFSLQGTSSTTGHVRAADAMYCCQSNGHFSPTEGTAHQHPASLEAGLLQGHAEDVQIIIADHSKSLLQRSGAGEGASCMEVEMLACKAPNDPSTAAHDGRQNELAGPGPHANRNGVLASQGVPFVPCCPNVQDQEAGGTIPTVQPKQSVEGLAADPAALNKLLFQVFEDPAQHANLAGQPTPPAETALQLEPQDSLHIGPGQTSSSDPVHADCPRQLVPCPDVDDSSRSAGDTAHVEDSNLQCSRSFATGDGPALGSAAVKAADLSADAFRGSVLGRKCAPKLQPELQPAKREARNANCPAPAPFSHTTGFSRTQG